VKEAAPAARRRELLQALDLAGRESSTATVLFHAAVAAHAGLAASDIKTLDLLLRHGPLTAGELAAQTGLATASVTSLIDRLEQKDLVQRVRDPQDRRRVIVEAVGARAEASLAPLFGRIQQAFQEVLEEYSNEQLETLLDFMRRTAERVRRLTAALSQEGVEG
jgi:DNA-binding MarR family transcriptional regulator